MFKCAECSYMTVYKSNLTRHEKTHRSLVVTEEPHSSLCCPYCKKVFSCSSNRWRHEKTCYAKPEESTASTSQPTPVSSTTNYIQNNIQNNIIIVNGDNKPPMVFKFEENPDEPLDFHLDHMLKTQRRYKGIQEVLEHLLEDPHNLPMRKMDERSPYSEVHVGDDKWRKKRDKEITPLFLYHSCNAIRDANLLRQTKILDEYLEMLCPVFESIMQSPEYQDDSDEKLQQQNRKHLKSLYQMIKLYMLERGQRSRDTRLVV